MYFCPDFLRNETGSLAAQKTQHLRESKWAMLAQPMKYTPLFSYFKPCLPILSRYPTVPKQSLLSCNSLEDS